MTTVQFEVGKGKTDTEVFHVVLDDGPGIVTEGPADDVDFTMILKPADFAAVVAGERTLDVGYMQGWVKVTGNVGRLLSVLPMFTTPEFAGTLADASERTG
ncbi:SCP2 sterol-binding domain-containing protein [Actinospongicola halichondriae]|uniref:SCP2 sterol-binding domain-containing protein n=1 Tax=Actinospongicola halichondriae TaxID=3236844 RepID=UPI003D503660